MKVICISGHAGHGKDTAANLFEACLTEKGKRVLITHYADLLKYICKQYFGWDGEKDVKGRQLLQTVGTNTIREKNPDFWVDFIISILRFFPDEWDYVIIPDTRFPNEIERLKEDGFDVLHVNVHRPGYQSLLTKEQQNHPSETAMDGIDADVLLMNNAGKSELYGKIEQTCITVLHE